MIVVLPSLTPEKVELPGSELPRSRSVITSRCKHGSISTPRCTLERNVLRCTLERTQGKYEALMTRFASPTQLLGVTLVSVTRC